MGFPLSDSPYVSPWPIQNQSTIPGAQQVYPSLFNYQLPCTAQSHSNVITPLFEPQWSQTLPFNEVLPVTPLNLLPNINVPLSTYPYANDYGLNQDIQFPSGEQISAETTPCSTYTEESFIDNQQEIPNLGDYYIWQR